jgi:hypothetical protein
MKHTYNIYTQIYSFWKENKLSFKEISDMEFHCDLSLKRIRNIIYKHKFNTEIERKIFSIYMVKFLKNKDRNKSIYYVYENQPKIKLSENTIRRIINYQKKNKQ